MQNGENLTQKSRRASEWEADASRTDVLTNAIKLPTNATAKYAIPSRKSSFHKPDPRPCPVRIRPATDSTNTSKSNAIASKTQLITIQGGGAVRCRLTVTVQQTKEDGRGAGDHADVGYWAPHGTDSDDA